MAKLPKQCPSCNAHLQITRLSCSKCGTDVYGTYLPDVFSRLEPNDFDFIVLFVRTKGNIKEMERELGISYWTIRSKLNTIVENMDLVNSLPSIEAVSSQREQILKQLNDGLISVQEAAQMLEALKIER